MIPEKYNELITCPGVFKSMKASSEFIKQLEIMFEQYEKEVLEKQCEGILEEKTVKTYLLHSNNFVRWCRNDFVPGARKAKVRR